MTWSFCKASCPWYDNSLRLNACSYARIRKISVRRIFSSAISRSTVMLLSDSWLSGEQMIPIKGFSKVESHAARQLSTGAVATLTRHNGWHLRQRLLFTDRLLVTHILDEKVFGLLHSFIFGQQKSIRLLPERLQHNGDPSWRWRYSCQMLACCVCHNAKIVYIR